MFVSSTILAKQQFILYAEYLNGTNTTAYQSIPFSVLSTVGKSNVTSQIIPCTNFLQPNRVEIYSEGFTITLLLFYSFIMILCVILNRFRPLFTRGVSPFLTTFILFIQLLLEIRNYFYITDYQGTLCLVLSLATYPLQQTVYIMILLYFVRYFAIINLNVGKNAAFTKIQARMKVDSSQFHIMKIRILKFVSSTWFAIIFILFSYLLVALVFIIVNGIGSVGYSSMTCTFPTLLAMSIINNIELIIIYGLTILTLLSDLVSNYKVIVRCKWFEYLFYHDPYWFRAQILLFMPFMVFSVIIGFISLASVNYSDIVNNYVATVILNTIQAAI
jgi:hypothetical protein